MVYRFLRFNFFSKRLLLPFLIFLLLSGCGIKDMFFKKSKVWLTKIHFKASEQLNDDSPLTVDTVIVYSEDLLKTLLKMDADTYFSKVTQLKLDNASDIEVFSNDIVPGQDIIINISPSRIDGEAAIIFARYSSKGNHRLKTGEDSEITILLDKSDFKLESKKAKS